MITDVDLRFLIFLCYRSPIKCRMVLGDWVEAGGNQGGQSVEFGPGKLIFLLLLSLQRVLRLNYLIIAYA